MLYYMRSVLTDNSSAPYLLRFENRNNGGLGKMQAASSDPQPPNQKVNCKIYREVSLRDADTSWVSVRFGNASIAMGGKLTPVAFADRHGTNDTTFFSSKPFLSSGSVTISGELSVSTKSWAKPIPFALELVDSLSGQVVVGIQDVSRLSLTGSPTTMNIAQQILVGSSTRPLFLRMRQTIQRLSGLSADFNEIQVLEAESAKKGSADKTALETPLTFALESPYPNPFNPSTQIRYSLPEAGKVSLMIYDVLGREIANLANGYQQAGRYTVTWNSKQNSNVPVSSGVYFARLRVTNDLGMAKFTKTSRLLLMK
jgi:hypothetical protein